MISPKLYPLSALVLAGTAAVASAHPVAPPAFKLKVFAGAPNKATVGPDDIASLNGHVFVGWQNNIGPTGTPGKPGGVTDSLVVEYNHRGRVIGRWKVKGKVDGLGGDASRNAVIATVNEDGNTSMYTIKPSRPQASQVVHYTYSPSPDSPGKSVLLTGGGTDSVTVIGGKILISASAPTRRGRSATFAVTLNPAKRIAKLHTTFADNARATDAVSGAKVKLHLTDPDSNAVVPRRAGLFGGDYMLDSQADGELIFAHGIGTAHPSLQRLQLTYGPRNDAPATVDDVRWAPSAGATLYVVDAGANKVYTVTGPFQAGDAVAAMDTVNSKTFGTVVATLNPGSGELNPLITGLKTAKGLLFLR